MVIAVNTRHLAGFIFDCFSILAEKYPQHQFIYIFDKAYDKQLITSNNIIPVVAGPEARSVLRMQYWYRYKVPAVLRKYKAAVFVSMDGSYSLRTKVPQPKNLQNLIKYRSASPAFQPINEQESASIKEKYTGGNEYFIYTGSIGAGSNLLNLMKAFSFFKKRQKSSMQLVIAGKTLPGYKQFSKDLASFKFRNEVKLLDDLTKNELARVVAGAYAMVYPVLVEDLSAHALEGMQCGVPVIVSSGQLAVGSWQEAVLYADPGDFMDIADKMMTVFKDERRRNELILAGKAAVAAFSPARTANMLWDSINFAAAHL